MKKIKTIIMITAAILLPGHSEAQTGGDNTYEFLNLSTNSLVTALGGINVSLPINDPGIGLFNPSLINPGSHNIATLNIVNWLAGVNYGNVSWSNTVERYGSFAGGITYMNYGKFQEADPSGNITGSFSASEVAINLLWSRQIDTLIRVGINIKPVISHLERYTSVGLVADIGASWISSDGLMSAGLVIRNAGIQLTTYTGLREKVPLEIVGGFSVKLAHAPFRFSFTARHLEKYNLLYEYLENPTQVKSYSPAGEIAENIMRHLVIGAEFSPTENFFIAMGFNYQKRRELSLEERVSTVGFSVGAGIKLSTFELSLSRSRIHLAGAATSIGIVLKPEAFNRNN